jgi:hypothetical protein
MVKVGPSKLSPAKVLHSSVVLVVKQVFPYLSHIIMQRLLNPSHPNNTFKKELSSKQINNLKPLPEMAKNVLCQKGCPEGVIQCEFYLTSNVILCLDAAECFVVLRCK